MRNDHTTGAMVICDSAEQAKNMARAFEAKYTARNAEAPSLPEEIGRVVEPTPLYTVPNPSVDRHALILHDVGTKKERKTQVDAFKEGKIDILFVYNMLLTGFDAARLKKLYLGRIIKAHNLLQALTRVNRPYKSFRYGFVVDFVDIEREFEKTTKIISTNSRRNSVTSLAATLTSLRPRTKSSPTLRRSRTRFFGSTREMQKSFLNRSPKSKTASKCARSLKRSMMQRVSIT